MEFTIETLPDTRIVYVRNIGPYGPQNAQAMERLKDWANAHELLTLSSILLGIPQDHPLLVPPDQCRYDACLVTQHPIKAGDPLHEAEFEGGTYAVFRIPHTSEGVQTAWADAFSTVQKAGYRLNDKPAIERYSGLLLQQALCELCVPILRP